MKSLKKNKMGIIFIIPAFILIMLFSIIPIFITLLTSFTNLDLLGLADRSTIEFVGLENFKRLFEDPRFWKSVKNSIYYVVIGVPLAISIALVLALSINYLSERAQTIFRSVYYAPALTTAVAISVVWIFMYNSDYGIFNQVLALFGLGPIGFLNDPEYAKLSLIVMSVWKGIGLKMIIMLAALKSIPYSLYEAAAIDGLSRVKVFFKITLPHLSFAIFFVLITTLIAWFQYFEEPFVMTSGGPNDATMSVALYIYEVGFANNDFGYAAAVSLVLFVIIMFVTALQFYVQKKGGK